MNYEKALRLLGLDSNYSESDLKKAYRRMAKLSHPDAETGDAERFKLVRNAYEILKTGSSSVTTNRGRQTVRKQGNARYMYHGDSIFEYTVK